MSHSFKIIKLSTKLLIGYEYVYYKDLYKSYSIIAKDSTCNSLFKYIMYILTRTFLQRCDQHLFNGIMQAAQDAWNIYVRL